MKINRSRMDPSNNSNDDDSTTTQPPPHHSNPVPPEQLLLLPILLAAAAVYQAQGGRSPQPRPLGDTATATLQLMDLPDELLERIASFLPQEDIMALWNVNRRMQKVCRGARHQWEWSSHDRRSLQQIASMFPFLHTLVLAEDVGAADLLTLHTLHHLHTLDLGASIHLGTEGLFSLPTYAAQLTQLCLPANTMDQQLAFLGNMPRLGCLQLWGCQHVTDAGLLHLGPCTGLQELVLDSPAIVGPGLSHLAGLVGLTSLTVVNAFNPDYLPALPALKTLRLSDATIESLAAVLQQTQLCTLDLRYSSSLAGPVVGPLSALACLSALRLDDCHSVSDLAALSALTNLRTLHLSHCTQLQDLDLAGIATLPNLQVLNLYGCEELSRRGLRLVSHVPSVIRPLVAKPSSQPLPPNPQHHQSRWFDPNSYPF